MVCGAAGSASPSQSTSRQDTRCGQRSVSAHCPGGGVAPAGVRHDEAAGVVRRDCSEQPALTALTARNAVLSACAQQNLFLPNALVPAMLLYAI